ARADRRPALAVRPDAIERARQDAGGRGLADAAYAGEDEGMGDAAGRDGVGERAHHRLLADQLGEGSRAILAREHAIMGARLSHGTSGKSSASDGQSAWSSGAVSWRSAGLPIDGAAAFRIRGGRPDSDPGRNSLRLLPSGPDRVGERPAHRRPPAALYQVRPAPGQGRSGGGEAPSQPDGIRRMSAETADSRRR